MDKIGLYAAVAAVTSLGNWGIPVAIYAKKFGLFKTRPEGFIGCNFWGVIMDVFIASAANLVILNFLLSINAGFNAGYIIWALFLGIVFSAGIHIFMAVTFWKEWIMPRPWHWNEAGYWHMMSAAIQMAYIFYIPVLIFNNPSLLELTATRMTLITGLVFGFMFLLSVRACKKGVKIGTTF